MKKNGRVVQVHRKQKRCCSLNSGISTAVDISTAVGGRSGYHRLLALFACKAGSNFAKKLQPIEKYWNY
ncbi:MAG: hypothetical protein V4751_06550 [Pseudomonadota bacterium]